jgi:20S proteasome alpha/beta subunit
MTVCVASIAAESAAIVMIADKMVTLGNMVSDTSICKISQIGNLPWYVALAGEIGTADEIILRVCLELEKQPDEAKSHYTMMKLVSGTYRDVYQEHLVAEVLTPKLLTADTAFNRPRHLLPLHDNLLEEIASDRQRFEQRWSCALLIAGYDATNNPHLFSVAQQDLAVGQTREGFGAIGIGADAASGRLMYHETNRDHPLERVLWETFDAKVQAEIMNGVGCSWDAFIILRSNPTQSVRIPRSLEKTMDNAITEIICSPFDDEPVDDSEKPPEDWKEQIKQFADSLIPRKIPEDEGKSG